MATQPIVPNNPNPIGGKSPNNPGGTQIPNPVPGGGTPTGTPTTTMLNNPLVPLGGGPNIVPGGTVPSSPNNPTNPGFVAPSISSPVAGTTALGGLIDDFGSSLGTSVNNTLNTLGTATNSAVEATNAESMLNAGKGFDTLRAQQAGAGISPNSSSAALEGSDYWAQVNTGLTATDANMELQQEDTLLSTLTGAGAEHGPDESGFSKFTDVAGPVLETAGMLAML